MIPEFANFALIIALGLACIQASLPLIGSYRNNSTWMQLARPCAYGQLVFILVSYACLTYAFISNDFSVAYVAENSNTHLPLIYRIAAVWGAHEGSMLLWVMILSIWTAAVARFSRQLPLVTIARVLAILAWISIGFLLFILATSNPFLRFLVNVPKQGQDLNPLLQDPGLAFHPPMLYMGYVGFAVAFAFAITALLSKRLDNQWLQWTRPWVLIAWCFLTLGIVLGSWWSYRELGWGGWWSWDPVENASFLPWLVGTALIHSMLISAKRDAFKGWTILLAIIAFCLSLLGTFLVRSGVLTSVHAFAVDPTRGIYMLVFLFIVICASLLLYGLRSHTIINNQNLRFSILSRETLLLLNTMLLVVIMATILLGTLYPLLIDALHAGKISVGSPYFNAVFIPLAIPILLLVGVGPISYWQRISWRELAKKLWFVMFVCLCLAGILLFIFPHKYYLVLGVTIGVWITLTTLQKLLQRLQRQPWRQWQQISLRFWGMIIAHLGVGICVIGISVNMNLSMQKNVVMKPGESVHVGNYDFRFMDLTRLVGPNYQGVDAKFNIYQRHRLLTQLNTQKRLFTSQQYAMSAVAISFNLFRDLYVALGDPFNDGAWSVRLYVKPFVRWIWLGGLLMMLGGIIAASKRNKLGK